MNANIQVADQLISKLVDEDVLKRTDERIRALLYSDPLIMATLQEPRAQRNTSVYKLRDPMLKKLRQNNELSGELNHILTIIMDHLRVQMEADVDECFTLPAEKDLDE